MDLKEKVIASVCLTALIGMGMLVGWAILGTDYWWLAIVLLLLSPITVFALTRD